MIANQYVRDTPDVTNAPIRTLLTLDNGGNWELVSPFMEKHLHMMTLFTICILCQPMNIQ